MYSKGKELLATVDYCKYANEDLLSVYTFNSYNLLVTRNRFLLVDINTNNTVIINVRFDEVIAIREKEVDGYLNLCFICIHRGKLFQNSRGNPFSLQFEEKTIVIGRKPSANRITTMLKGIIEKEIVNHNSRKMSNSIIHV